MRLGGRLAAAIEILQDIDERHRPASDAMRDWGLSHRYAGAGDRAAIGNMVHDALRRRLQAAWLTGSDTPRGQVIGARLIETGETPEALAAAMAEDRFVEDSLSPEEVEAIKARPTPPDDVKANCPDWCIPLLRETFADGWAAEGAALSARPPLDLRVNMLKGDRQRVLKALAKSGAQPAAVAPHGIRIPAIRGDGRHPNVQAEPAYQKGWFEVQDEGSQIASQLAASVAGKQVLDYCAGAGGKTLALSASFANRGQIFAFDTDKARLSPIFERLRRAGTRNVQVVAEEDALSGLVGQVDTVLVDAPCTGSGTWRRRPDAKWRLKEQQLEARLAEQAEILEKAQAFLRPGGRLVYVTCSVFRAENQSQIKRFLKAHPEFAPEDHDALWRKALPEAAPESARIDRDEGILLTPHRTATDGFYVAVLTRSGSN